MLRHILDRIITSKEELLDVLDSGSAEAITFINPYSYLVLRRSFTCRELSLYRYGVDGILLSKLLAIALNIKIQRISFDNTSVAPIIFNALSNAKSTVFIVGSTQESIGVFKRYVTNIFPGLAVIGFRNGFFKSNEERDLIIGCLVKTNPNCIVVGMGTPIQEQFLTDCYKAGWSGIGFTCGGFIHQTAKKGHVYYPNTINKLHLRWLYRIFDEPKLLKRYLIDYPKFLVIFGFDVFMFYFSKLKK